jgi:hypothetical protein
VYCKGWDPTWSDAQEAAAFAATARGAEALGRDLLVVSTNVRDALWNLIDWIDAHGPALAMVGLSIPRAVGRFTIASNVSHAIFLPRGSHPQLDPLWSTERVEILHDHAHLDRAGKVMSIARERPDMLDHLWVCTVDPVTNCGTCVKCALTMAGLETAERSAGRAPSRPRVMPGHFGRRPRRCCCPDWARMPPTPRCRPGRSTPSCARRSPRCSAGRAEWEAAGNSISVHTERLLRAVLAGRPHAARAAGPETPPSSVGAVDPSWPPPRNVPAGRIGLLATVDGASAGTGMGRPPFLPAGTSARSEACSPSRWRAACR